LIIIDTLVTADATVVDNAINCANCAAICCRSEVLLLTETGVPARFIDTDAWGGSVMLRLDDGWCAALDRNTMLCTIYENRPLICRDFEMGASDCIAERAGLETVYQLSESIHLK
jgi:Fe-S-cluster containining protein